MKHTWIKISEPIDFKALSLAFSGCGWKYWNGFPSEDYLRDSIADSQADLKPFKGTNQIRRTGGISIEWEGDEMVVLLDSRISAQYNPWVATVDPIPSQQ